MCAVSLLSIRWQILLAVEGNISPIRIKFSDLRVSSLYEDIGSTKRHPRDQYPDVISCPFAWAIKSTYRRRLSVVYSTDIPTFILESGPFGVVRDPFYTSYILFWFSFVVMQPALINGLMALLLFGLYLNAALFEETKFARSALSSAYRDYSDRKPECFFRGFRF